MKEKIYILAWFLLGAAAFASVVIGMFDALTVVALSLVALGLVHGLALWSVLTNTGEVQPE